MTTPLMVHAIIIPVDVNTPITNAIIDVSENARWDIMEDGQPSVVQLGTNEAHAYCDEIGKPKGLALNSRATRFMDHYLPGFAKRDFIAGPFLIVGTDQETGRPVDVPQALIDVALSWEITPI